MERPRLDTAKSRQRSVRKILSADAVRLETRCHRDVWRHSERSQRRNVGVDGITWTRTLQTGPPLRYDFAMAFDEARECMVVFGGQGAISSSDLLGDTWTLRAPHPQITQAPMAQIVQLGQ